MPRRLKFSLHELEAFAEKYWAIDRRIKKIVHEYKLDSTSEDENVSNLDAKTIDNIGVLWKQWLDRVQDSVKTTSAISQIDQGELQKSFERFIIEKKQTPQTSNTSCNTKVLTTFMPKISQNKQEPHFYEKECAEIYAECLLQGSSLCLKDLSVKKHVDEHQSRTTEQSHNLIRRGSILGKFFTRALR